MSEQRPTHRNTQDQAPPSRERTSGGAVPDRQEVVHAIH